MKTRLGVFVGSIILLVTTDVFAMPTRAELLKARERVVGLMSDDVRALKAGALEVSDAAARHLQRAEETRDEAERYLLMQGALKLYKSVGDEKHVMEVLEAIETRIGNIDAALARELAGVDRLPTKTFALGTSRELKLIACPPGTFTMDGRRVTITRPFWLGEVAVTREQFAKICRKIAYTKRDFDVPKTNSSLAEKTLLMEKLTQVFAAEIPKGYVFRLPTEAEYVYAMTSGGKDVVNELSIGVLGPSADEKKAAAAARGESDTKLNWYKPMEVARKEANTWGFYDAVNNGEPIVLDRVVPGKARQDEMFDPLAIESGEGVCSLGFPQESLSGRKFFEDWDWLGVFRVCLGPDLVAEKTEGKTFFGAY